MNCLLLYLFGNCELLDRFFENTIKSMFLQISYWWNISHLWSLWHYDLWTVLMWVFKFPASENVFPQESHAWSFWPLWTELMCLFKFPASENDFPQESHLWSFWLLWTELMCVFKFPNEEHVFPHESHLWSFCHYELN